MKLAALVVAVAALLVPAAALASERHPTQGEIESEVMCPVCATTLDQSDSAVARQMKMFIAARRRAGDTKTEIKRELVANFGEAVLAAPPKEGFNLLAWLLPLFGLALAAPVVGYAAWRWSRAREPAPPPEPLEPELERRLERELARLDG